VCACVSVCVCVCVCVCVSVLNFNACVLASMATPEEKSNAPARLLLPDIMIAL